MKLDPPLLEMTRATVWRSETRVFHDFSLRLAAGQNTVVLGPNGSGKTTLLKVLTRELHAVHSEEASVSVFGERNWNVFELRQRLGIVSQDLQITYLRPVSALDVVLSGFFSSIGLHAHNHVSKEAVERAEHALEELGVADLRRSLFWHLSTGQQRRCLLARALVHDPGTLVLDEPTTGLDLKASFALIELLRALVAKGKTLVLVTHHLEEVLPEVANAVLLKGGRVFASGTKESVLTEDALSATFDVRLALVRHGGFLRAIPA